MANPVTPLRTDPTETPAAFDAGPRKLVRPILPDVAASQRKQARKRPMPVLTRHDSAVTSSVQSGSQAEVFYFQKQMQTQTPLLFVLDDGERIEGVVEWCDLHVIKVRHITRTLIYKSSIKYVYKASEASDH